MKTKAEAIAAGLTVDTHAAGRPIAYRGARFEAEHMEPLLTDLEERLIAALRKISDNGPPVDAFDDGYRGEPAWISGVDSGLAEAALIAREALKEIKP